MKKLILLLLFIPLISFGQSQIVNGIELNGRQGMTKTGDLTWEDDDSSISVVSFGKMILTKKQKEDTAKRGNRYLNFEFSHIVSTSFSDGGKIADEQAITKIHENFGYILGRILLD
jgi:hypothetical protein